MKVSAKALSVFCPHCQKRAQLESMRIIGSHPGKTLATCGDIIIESTAKLNLAISANNVYIQGRIRGPVVANETVEVGPTGQVFGSIKAAKLVVQHGAVIEGKCEMVPTPLHQPKSTAEQEDGEPEQVPDESPRLSA